MCHSCCKVEDPTTRNTLCAHCSAHKHEQLSASSSSVDARGRWRTVVQVHRLLSQTWYWHRGHRHRTASRVFFLAVANACWCPTPTTISPWELLEPRTIGLILVACDSPLQRGSPLLRSYCLRQRRAACRSRFHGGTSASRAPFASCSGAFLWHVSNLVSRAFCVPVTVAREQCLVVSGESFRH